MNEKNKDKNEINHLIINDDENLSNNFLLNKKSFREDVIPNENNEKNSDNDKKENEEFEEKNDEDNADDECEENNDDESGDEENHIILSIFKGIKGKEKWYAKKKNVPPSTNELDKNIISEVMKEKMNSEVITMLELKETFISPFSNNYIGIKELSNGYFFILFDNIFYIIEPTTLKKLNNNESLQKYFSIGSIFISYFEQINDELIGIVALDFLLIVKYDNKEVTFFQEIPTKATIFKSFPSENLIIINEFIHNNEKKLNILYYYLFDGKTSQYQLQKKEEVDFSKFGQEIIEFCNNFSYISNVKKLKNGKMILFTFSTILLEEKQKFDDLDRSFYERECGIILDIYFYENKELSLIYRKKCKQNFIYDDDISDSYDFQRIPQIWSDRNIRINEEEKQICFFIPNLNKDYMVIYDPKKIKHRTFENSDELKYNYYYDENSKLYFLEKSNGLNAQYFSIYDSGKLINNIYLPYFFSDIIPTKKGFLFGVIRNARTDYNFYSHLGRYAPSKTILTNLCLLKYTI